MYALTEEGAESVVNIISEFCHGFTIEEIASNSDFTEDQIKVLMLLLLQEAGIVELGEDFE